MAASLWFAIGSMMLLHKQFSPARERCVIPKSPSEGKMPFEVEDKRTPYLSNGFDGQRNA
ncbi:hypothetical protein HPP92_027650 [Vanilla planifolia]|uniref:Uncharacterized protein n=1 Tax=Vanilla planifolia TaxID=51239 RepID=A0A835PBP8_VANPL|nr:hypothetical protein HPP92_027650 [Vanilla planifolia]